MVDYKAIADGDPGGDLETAFAAMAAETLTRSRGEYKLTDIMVARALGLNAANAFLDAVEAAVPVRVIEWMRGGGIDINHADTVATLNLINPPNKDAVLALGSETVAKYPGLLPGHLQNARQKRAAGEV